jgi:hypothetical protein
MTNSSTSFFMLSVRSGAADNVFENNQFRSTHQVVSIARGSGDAPHDNIFTGNVILAGTEGITLGDGAFGQKFEQNLIVSRSIAVRLTSSAGPGNSFLNNTIVSSRHDAVRIDLARGSNPVVKIRGNILFSGTNPPIVVQDTKLVESDYNLLFRADGGPIASTGGKQLLDLASWRATSGKDAHSVMGDPNFVNASGDDYRLASGSPAIDAGDPALGTGFPGGRADIGAIEHQPTQTRPPTPTRLRIQ